MLAGTWLANGLRRAGPALLAAAMAGSTLPSMSSSLSHAALLAGQASGDTQVSGPLDPPPYVDGVVLVRFRPNAGPTERRLVQAAVGTLDARPISASSPDLQRLTLPPGMSVTAAARRLAGDPRVHTAEPDYLIHVAQQADDTFYVGGSLWGMYGDATTPANAYGSQAAEAWEAGHVGSRSIYVGMVDVGMQIDHPELAPNVWTNPFDPADGVDNDGNGYVDDVHGWDFLAGDNTVYDGLQDDHGTAVAGTLGAQGGNAEGVAGVNWELTVIPAKVANGGVGSVSAVIAAFDYLADLKSRHGLNVVAGNNSWYTPFFSQLLLDAINRAADQGVLLVAPSGNGVEGQGQNNDGAPLYPASYECVQHFDTGLPRDYDCVIAVAAINPFGGRSTFSNYGPASVDLGAPGSHIVTTWPYNQYTLVTGTSIAVPFVTGAIALCASINPALSPKQLRAVTLGTVAPTSSLAGRITTGGRIDIGSMAPKCQAPVGGQHLTLSSGAPSASWVGGKQQTAYWVLRFSDGELAPPVNLPASATSYQLPLSGSSFIECMVIMPSGAVGQLGLTDLLCLMPGASWGVQPPLDTTLSLRDGDVAHLTWAAPASPVDTHLLVTIPLGAGPGTVTPLGGGFTAAQVPVPPTGACFQLVAVRGSTGSAGDLLCGFPGVSTFGGGALEGRSGIRATVTGAVGRLAAALPSAAARSLVDARLR